MLEMLVYPVSTVMRFWHWLLVGVFGLDEVRAWVPCIVLLVLTIRGIILPFAWQTFKSTRKSFLMRPHLSAVEERYGTSVDPEDLRAEEDARKQIQREHGYNPFASCVPALIQIPMFLGLYRLLLWMALPGAAGDRRIGVLTDAEVTSFRDATFHGVPLPAYVAMTDEQFDFLGTSLADVRSLALPLIITAIVLTSTNMVISQLRTRSTLEWDNTATRRMYRVVYLVIPLVAVSLALGGLTGRVPVALLMYWVVNNLFTTTQTAVFWLMVVRKFPADEVHREHQRAARAEYLRAHHEVKARKRAARRKRASAVLRPHTALRVHRELRDAKLERKQVKQNEKAEKKALNKQRKSARKELMRRQSEERAAARAAAKAAAAGVVQAPTIEGSTRWEPAHETAETTALADGAAEPVEP